MRAKTRPREKVLVECTRGILLLGTPHFQPDKLTAATKYFQLAQIPDEEIPKGQDLVDRSDKIVSIPQVFAKLKESETQIEMECFYAGSATKINDKAVKIVDESLAQAPGAPAPERLARTHQGLSQFESEDDKDFGQVLSVLTQWVGAIAPPQQKGNTTNIAKTSFGGANYGMQLGQNTSSISGLTFNNTVGK